MNDLTIDDNIKNKLEELFSLLSKRRILFSRYNKLISKTKLNITILETKDFTIFKFFHFYLNKNIFIYDYTHSKIIKTGDFGITSNLKKDNNKIFIHVYNDKKEVLNSMNFNIFINNKCGIN